MEHCSFQMISHHICHLPHSPASFCLCSYVLPKGMQGDRSDVSSPVAYKYTQIWGMKTLLLLTTPHTADLCSLILSVLIPSVTKLPLDPISRCCAPTAHSCRRLKLHELSASDKPFCKDWSKEEKYHWAKSAAWGSKAGNVSEVSQRFRELFPLPLQT